MKYVWVKPILLVCLILSALAMAWPAPSAEASGAAQIPTGSKLTVTSTPGGPKVMVVPGNEPQANLRAGPGALYDRVGILLVGQSAPAKGRSPGGEWILIEYPGGPNGQAWVYAPLVQLDPPSMLPIVEPPPSPTPAVIATLDPTLAARFVITQEPTRLPTFTPPPPLVLPTFPVETGPSLAGVPMGFVIIGLAVLGLFFGVVAFSQGR